jgi:hypothetical protein
MIPFVMTRSHLLTLFVLLPLLGCGAGSAIRSASDGGASLDDQGTLPRPDQTTLPDDMRADVAEPLAVFIPPTRAS